MDHNSLSEQLSNLFPDFAKSKPLIDELIEVGSFVEIAAGNTLIDTGDYIKVIPFLINGLIKIYRQDDEGNEILLYYINSGESCVISITLSLKDEVSSIKAHVEEDSTVFVVPNAKFEYLLGKYSLLHSFTYDLFNLKYNQLISSIDVLAFTDMKTRLMNYLVAESNAKDTELLEGLTHKQIATDLASSREVISRLLSSLQKDGRIKMIGRKIQILS